MTALYIRTVSTNELPERDGRWKLPEDIDVEKGIAVMEEYAESHGYKDPIIFLDDGYTGTGAIAPAYLFMQQIIKHTNLIDTVIISDLHQINGGMNILMMTNELFTNRGVKLIIAAYNEEAGKLINRYYDEWVEEEVLYAAKNADEGVPIDDAIQGIRDFVELHKLRGREDILTAKKQPEKHSAKGTRIINAEEARWFMKTKAVKKFKEAYSQ